jgi:hypothetical protein
VEDFVVVGGRYDQRREMPQEYGRLDAFLEMTLAELLVVYVDCYCRCFVVWLRSSPLGQVDEMTQKRHALAA